MKTLKLFKLNLLIALLFGVGTVFSQPVINPINILMDPVATDCGEYDVNLLTQQYINVANISMTLDISSLYFAGAYVGITMNTTAWPALSNAITYVNPQGDLKVSWSSDPFPANAITLPDNTVLFTLHFDVNGIWGTSHDLAWDDVLTIDCELSGPNGYPIYPDYWNDLHWDIQQQLDVVADVTGFMCPLDPTGAIDLTVLGGVPPFTYSWTGTVTPPYPPFTGSTNQDLTGLFPGTYCVTVTDADFCEVSACFTVNQIPHPGPREIGGPVPIASTIECAFDAVAPILPLIEDECGTVLLPTGPVMGGTYVDCEGTITWTYTYEDYLGQQLVWTYTYTVEHSTPPAEVGGPVPFASTVECIYDAVPPILPIVADVCGNYLTTATLVEGGTYVDCEGTKTYTYTWTDCAGLTFVWTYTYTIERSTPPAEVGTPVPVASTVECIYDAVPPILPIVADVCGNYLTTATLVEGGTYVDCEGTKTYTYTWTDCAGLTFVWTYTYTIEHSTPPAEVGGPVPIASTVECIYDAVPPILPIVADVCGNYLTTATLVEGGTYVDCEGTKTYTYTWTDCAGLTFVWTYTYTIEHSTPPAEVGTPVPIASTVECIYDAVPPILPIVADVCGNYLTTATLVEGGTYVDCEGTKTYTYTWTDCAGLTFVWTYTYTIEHSTPPVEVGNPVPTASTVECNIEAVPPTMLPVVEDVCGNIIPAPIPVMSNPVNCEGAITWTYTYYDCADLAFVWVYTYTIEHSTPPAEVGGPVSNASTVPCIIDAIEPGAGSGTPQNGFAGYFDPANWTLQTNGGTGSIDVTGAPATVALTGSNGNSGNLIDTDWEIVVLGGTIEFAWNYTTFDVDGPAFDPFGYKIDGIFYQLTDDIGPDSQNGIASVIVPTGSLFAMSIRSYDDAFGAAVDIVGNFVYTPSGNNLPVVEDVCGNVLTPTGPVVSGTYDGCEGTKIYTYTYTDCAGLDFVWAYTYTIEVEDFVMPADDGETIVCATDLYTPVPPVVNDNCGNLITPTGPVVSPTPACNGTVTYVWNYEDCEGNNHDWTYTFIIIDDVDPTIACPADITVYMNDGCTWILDPVVLGTPVVGDNCDPNPVYYSNAPAIFPEGLTTITWTVEDCAGNSATCTQYVLVIRNILSGTMVYNNILPFGPPKIMNNVDITLYDDVMTPLATSTTNYLGQYYFPELCAGTYYVAVTKNNKPAGGVNTTDAGQVLTYGFQPYPVESVRWLAGDANGVNFINIADVGKIVSKFVYNSSFAPKADWNYYWAGSIHPNNASYPALPMSIVIGGGNAVGNIFGQCTGDFNGNFSPGVMKSESESLTLNLGQSMLVEANAEVELPVYAGMDMEVGAVSLILNFPSNEAEITGVFLSSNPSSPLQYNVEGNELRIGWYSLAPVWLNKGESLITIQLKVKGETSAEGIQFSLAIDPLNELADGNFNVISAASLIIDVPSTSAMGAFDRFSTGNVELSNHPNPFKGTTTLSYNLPVDGKVVIEVYDLLGTLVQTMVNENQTAGQYALQLDANSLQPGIYTAVLKLNSAGQDVMIRAIKMINK
jgi:hypothetical protein